MSNTHGSHVIDQTGSVFRDAWVAKKCAEAFAPDGVRLGADPPDFELSFTHRVQAFETVEVQKRGRRRGDELRADRLQSPEERARSVHVPHTPASEALEQLAAAAQAKAAKRYTPETILVVYLNAWFIADEARVWTSLARVLAPATAAFKEVWVLDSGELHQVTSAGQ
jgi:hypothetical protein